MPRVHDNVAGRSMVMRLDANGTGSIRARNLSTAAIVQYEAVQVAMDRNGYTVVGPSTYAAATGGLQMMWLGTSPEAHTAAEGIAGVTDMDVHVLGPSKLFTTVACTTNGLGCIQRTTGAYVDAASATYTGYCGQWAMMRTITTAVSTVSIDVMLLGRPILRNGTTVAL